MWRHGIPSRQYDAVPGDALQCGEGGLQLVPRGPRTSLTFRTRMVGVYNKNFLVNFTDRTKPELLRYTTK